MLIIQSRTNSSLIPVMLAFQNHLLRTVTFYMDLWSCVRSPHLEVDCWSHAGHEKSQEAHSLGLPAARASKSKQEQAGARVGSEVKRCVDYDNLFVFVGSHSLSLCRARAKFSTRSKCPTDECLQAKTSYTTE